MTWPPMLHVAVLVPVPVSVLVAVPFLVPFAVLVPVTFSLDQVVFPRPATFGLPSKPG